MPFTAESFEEEEEETTVAAVTDNGHSAAAATAAAHPPLPRAALVTAAAAVQDTASRAREMLRRKAPLMELAEGVARGQYKMAFQISSS